jgi:ADP-ribose pyrophosphatase
MSRTLLITPRFRVEEIDVPCSDGTTVRKPIVRHPGAVAVIPVLDENHVGLIRNRRPTIGATLVEIPAGTRDPQETPDQTAHRELLEETGYRAGQLTLLCRFFTSPGVLDEEMHVFVARQLTASVPNPDAGEEIENLRVTWPDALRMVFDGTIRDAKTIAALLYYAHERLRHPG